MHINVQGNFTDTMAIATQVYSQAEPNKPWLTVTLSDGFEIQGTVCDIEAAAIDLSECGPTRPPDRWTQREIEEKLNHLRQAGVSFKTTNTFNRGQFGRVNSVGMLWEACQ